MQQRSSAAFARRVFARLLQDVPEPAASLSLEFLKDSIRLLEREGAQWSVTLHPNLVRVNAGPLERLILDQWGINLVLPRKPKPKVEIIGRRRGYAHAPECVLGHVPYDRVEQQLPGLRAAHHWALLQNADMGTSWRKAHSPGVLKFLAKRQASLPGS